MILQDGSDAKQYHASDSGTPYLAAAVSLVSRKAGTSIAISKNRRVRVAGCSLRYQG